MQKLQDSVFSIFKTTGLSPSVFNFLQPTEEFTDKTPQGGILSDTKFGWLSLGPKFLVVDLRTGLKVAAWTFGAAVNNLRTSVTSVAEVPTPLTENSTQLVISLENEDLTGTICVFHVNGSTVLRCIQTEVIVTQLAVCDRVPDGPFMCYDGVVMAGTRSGEIFVFDLHRAGLIQALKDTSQGYEHLVRNELNMANLAFLPLTIVPQIEEQREMALENDDHMAVLLNETSLVDGQYIFHNPDGTIRMKAKRDHIRVSAMKYIPQLGSLAVGFNFGAFQIWNLMSLDLEFTSQVNVECLPVTHFGFQEPCDDPRAFCYLWVVYSVIDRFEEEEFPLAVMYSLTYQGKRMLTDTKYLYQEFTTSNIRFQIELSSVEAAGRLVGGRCVSCHTFSVHSTLGEEGEESMLNLCQLVWECWGENADAAAQCGMLLFDLDQWYKDQMPATCQLQSSAFLSLGSSPALARCRLLAAAMAPRSLACYCHGSRLEEHFYPNSLHYNCVCLSTSEVTVLNTVGVQRQIINALATAGGSALLNPAGLYAACVAAGLTPLYHTTPCISVEDQRRYLLSVALEARLSTYLKRCAHDWATGSLSGAGCTLPFLVDWCWNRALELKQNAKELTAPLFTSSTLPDRNILRCLEHCVRQLTELTSLLDAVLTKCCNLVVPDALSEMEEKFKGIGTVALYLQVVQWFVGAGLLPERQESRRRLPYPGSQLRDIYRKSRVKLHRLQNSPLSDEEASTTSCPLLYIDQLIEHECGGESIHEMWRKGGSEWNGLYPPPTLYSLLRLYLLPAISQQHKHSLVLYLLVDYSMLYDELRYESVIRRLMQFPTMFGLSNAAIKATQAFWHLDHRDFDFALDQLQCLTGNTLSEWQHNVVLSALLAQKKTQAALQYLHVRKPAPIQNGNDGDAAVGHSNSWPPDPTRPEEWQSRCRLYLARELPHEALQAVRACASNASQKARALRYFFDACRNTGQLSQVLHLSLLPFEEEVFIKYLEDCNDQQTSDLLIMYYLQQARFLEAQQYNNKLKGAQVRGREPPSSPGSPVSAPECGARDALVAVACAAVPAIVGKVAHCVLYDFDSEPHVLAPKPMSVFVQANSPKNTFTYKSSFIQDTIENASETWVNKPQMRRGIKRALNIEETPFLCTPKLNKSRATAFAEDEPAEGTPPKRAKLDLTAAAKTPRTPQSQLKISDKLAKEMELLLDMPEVQTPPQWKIQQEIDRRTGRDTTPHSILKMRRPSLSREAPSPVDSRYLGESEDDMLETASNHTSYSDYKHLRFTIPTASESGSTPSPPAAAAPPTFVIHEERETERPASPMRVTERATPVSHSVRESPTLESPPKKFASEEKVASRKSYKDSVRARHSLSISQNSSLSEDPNTSVESIADIPVTLINPRYSGESRRYGSSNTGEFRSKKLFETTPERVLKIHDLESERDDTTVEVGEARTEDGGKKISPKTPQGRRSIRVESTPVIKSRPVTPERCDSPVITASSTSARRLNRSRSRTPELSPGSSLLDTIVEQPKQEVESAAAKTESILLSMPRQIRPRSRSRTPERVAASVKESPRLAAITESPTKSDVEESPRRRSLRSRSRTPEVEATPAIPLSPRSQRRSKTPDREKVLSPAEKPSKPRKSLSRMVLEHNAFSKTKPVEKSDLNTTADKSTSKVEDSVIECTPMKGYTTQSDLLDVTFSPIVNKSVLHSSVESVFSETRDVKITDDSMKEQKSLPAFTTISETFFEKSVLKSYQSSIADNTSSVQEEAAPSTSKAVKSKTHLEEVSSISNKSVLKDVSSLMTSDSDIEMKDDTVTREQENVRTELKKVEDSLIQKREELMNVQKEEKSLSQKIEASFQRGQQRMQKLEQDKQERNAKEQESLSQNKESNIQKEKRRIVEIEREIHEFEEGISDEGTNSEENDGEVASSGEEDDESGDEEAESDDESDDNVDVHNERDVISIDDSTSENEDIEQEDNDDDEDSPSPPSLPSSTSGDNNLQIDEQSNTQSQEPNLQELENVEVATESEPNAQDNKAESPMPEGSTTDPLNQAVASILTDDNSVMSNEPNEDEKKIETSMPETSAMDPLNQAAMSMMTDDNSVLSNESNVNLNYSDENKEEGKMEEMVVETVSETPIEINVVVEIAPEETKPIEDNVKVIPPTAVIEQEFAPADDIDVVDASAPKRPTVSVEAEITSIKESTTSEIAPKTPERESTIPEVALKSPEKGSTIPEDAPKSSEEEPTVPEIPPKTPENDAQSTEVKLRTEENTQTTDETQVKAIRTPSRTRKRATSTSSAKETQAADLKTPTTRKRAISTSSNKSGEELTPEKIPEDTPRKRGKTPTSAEVRRILTRRASKDLNESKSAEASKDLDESLSMTPKRRSKRSKSKNLDDNASVTSETSVKSTRSKASVNEDVETKPAPVRKQRKSILQTKPELSVIPEISTEEGASKVDESAEVMNEYSSSRRLTRHQKSLLQSWMEPTTPSPARVTRRRSSSRASIASGADDDASSTTSEQAFPVQAMDRIELLNRGSFEGSPDTDEFYSKGWPESVASDATKQPRPRLVRAASESRTLTQARVTPLRRGSVDVAHIQAPGSPASDVTSSPGRARRACFNKACEALATPKGRRLSTDLKRGETDSPQGSPAASESGASATPMRRARRPSTQSNTSQSSRRSKKAVEEV